MSRHFLLARKNKIRVNEFWIGMGPSIWKKKAGETEYHLKVLPFGGACVMGEDDEDDFSEGSFNSKSPWRRISVIFAGPFFNFILAFVCAFVFICIAGFDPTVISAVEPGTPAQEAGLEAGDRIVKLNGRSVHMFREVSMYNQLHQGEYMEVTFERDGKRHTVEITPEPDETGYYRMGVMSNGYQKGNLLENVQYGIYEVRYWINMTVEGLKQLVTGKVGMNQLSGPVGVVDAVDTTYKMSRAEGALVVFLNMLRMAVLLSANLGVMNLLPLPALDGGRLMFLFVEVIRGKRIPPEKEGYVHAAGMALLLVLMVFVVFNDIKRIFF